MIFVALLLTLLTFFSILFGGWYYTVDFAFWEANHWQQLIIIFKNLFLVKGYQPPEVMFHIALIAMFSSFTVLITSSILLKRISSKTVHGDYKQKALHGTARFGALEDIRVAQLMAKTGVVLGRFKKHILKHFGVEHILVFAPTRSGKGVSIVVPTLLDWTESAVVLDIKPELHELTSGYLKTKGHRIFCFDPSREESAKFNPLCEVRVGTPSFVSDVQRLVGILIDPYSKDADKYFTPAGYSWLGAVTMHLLIRADKENRPTPNFSDIAGFMSAKDFADYEDGQDGSIKAMCQSIIEYDHGDDSLNAIIHSKATEIKTMPDKQRGGVFGTASIALEVFQDPVISGNTSSSDFTIDSLMDDDKPTTLYLVFTSDDHLRLQPLIKMMIDTIIGKLGSRMTTDKRKHRLLLLLDEFTSVGKINSINKGISYVAGFGIKMVLIIQDLNQLEEEYGKNQSIVGNCHIRIAFAPNTIETAEQLSKLVGKTTIVQKKRNTSGSGLNASVSDSFNEIGRSLMTADEIMTMRSIYADKSIPVSKHRGGQVLIFIAGRRPVLADQDLFYQNKDLLSRTQLQAALIETDRPGISVDEAA